MISQHADAWHIHIDLHQPAHSPMTMMGFLTPTIDDAKKLADKELLNHGHICNTSCKPWVELQTARLC